MKAEKSLILSVDDEKINRMIVEDLLGDDYQVVSVSTGEEALLKLKTIRPAVVLLDIMMPGIDGYKVCQSIKNDPSLIYTKVILVSGKAMVEERLQGYKVGADDYITKPFDHDEFKAKVRVFSELFHVETKLSLLNKNLEEEVIERSAQIIEKEKFAYLGMHSAEIVHNLKNPLVGMMMSIKGLLKHYPKDDRIATLNEGILIFHEILGDILTNLPFKPNNLKKELDLNKIIREELDFFRINDFYRNKVTTSLELQEIPKLNAVKTHFSQIYANLIKNSIEAMVGMPKTELYISSGIDSTQTNIINTIRDTGAGISKENIDKIFNSRFTTKIGSSEGIPLGTGLGLPYCQRMIEFYGGKIDVESEVNKGSKFTLLIPVNSPLL